MSTDNGFGKFDFDESKVNSGLYGNGSGSQFPTITWHGKYSGNGSRSGFWTLDRAESETPPGPYWEEGEVQFGSSPDSPFSAVWITERLRACVLGQRKRILIFGEDGGQYSYPWLTKKTDRVSGQYKAHFQIAVTLPGTDDRIFQIALKGVSKTKAWANPESGQYRDSKFPKGAELMLRDYAALASREVRAKIPQFCSFWIDLVPLLNDKGTKAYIDIGHGTHVSSFTADFAIGNGSGLATRFVGMENFLRFQELRERDILQWEKAWEKGSKSSAEADPYAETTEDELGAFMGDKQSY